MVSQSSSVGYTIMGKTADLTVVQRRPLTPCTRRARHKRSLQKRLAVHRALSPSTLIEGRREGKDVVEKSVQAIGITAPWRDCETKPIQKCGGEIHKEWTAAGVSASRTTTHRRMQDMGFQLSHSLCQATLEQQTASEASRLDCCWVVQSYVLWWK